MPFHATLKSPSRKHWSGSVPSGSHANRAFFEWIHPVQTVLDFVRSRAQRASEVHLAEVAIQPSRVGVHRDRLAVNREVAHLARSLNHQRMRGGIFQVQSGAGRNSTGGFCQDDGAIDFMAGSKNERMVFPTCRAVMLNRKRGSSGLDWFTWRWRPGDPQRAHGWDRAEEPLAAYA